MIEGKVRHRRAFVTLHVYGTGAEETEVEFVLDTGFTGVTTLPPAVCSALGLHYIRPQIAGLADGSPIMLEVYRVTLHWDGKERIVEALAMEGEPLIDMTLLEGYDVRLRIRHDGFFTIEPSNEEE